MFGLFDSNDTDESDDATDESATKEDESHSACGHHYGDWQRTGEYAVRHGTELQAGIHVSGGFKAVVRMKKVCQHTGCTEARTRWTAVSYDGVPAGVSALRDHCDMDDEVGVKTALFSEEWAAAAVLAAALVEDAPFVVLHESNAPESGGENVEF
jgi:hypothetical protein